MLFQRFGEEFHGTDQRAEASNPAESAGGRGGRQAGSGMEQAFQLTQQQPPAEQAATHEEVGLFTPPTAQERNKAAQQQKDASLYPLQSRGNSGGNTMSRP